MGSVAISRDYERKMGQNQYEIYASLTHERKYICILKITFFKEEKIFKDITFP